jgi:ADP-ribosylglycohydrolase
MVQFGSQYPQAAQLQELLNKAIALAGKPEIAHWQAMEQLRCTTAAEVLAGAVYAILASGEDFDNAMIIAVNHSGKSAAVGALTGAMLGARLGEEALPEFYLECLACREILRELAADLDNSGPKGWRSRLFDDEWDRKYTHGLPSGI